MVQKCLKNFCALTHFPLKFTVKSCMHFLKLHKITPEEVSNCISNIKPYSAPGMKGILLKFVLLARCMFSPYLAKLFSKCTEQKIFPRDFKVAYVISIPKTSSPKTLDKFRPISLLSVFSKLFEQILKNKMLEFIIENNILTSFQFGFKANNSTELATTSFYDNLLNNINESKTTCSIFLALRKVFDSENHSILLKKLYYRYYGFREKY